MAHRKHGIEAKVDPDFKPDPSYVMVWDEVKKVFRKVKASEAGNAKKILSS